MCVCGTHTSGAVGKGECPKVKCNTMTRGFLYDHPHLGHLTEGRTGVGPNRPHTCYLMCRQTANCSFWMYDIKSKEGERGWNQGRCALQGQCSASTVPATEHWLQVSLSANGKH